MTKGRSQNIASVVRSVSRTMTTAASGARTNWPFFTMDNMEILAEDFLTVGPSVKLIYAPLVSEEERGQWEDYSVLTQEKVKNTTTYSYQIPGYIYSRHNNGTIFTNGATAPYSPVWQMIPPPTDYIDTSKVNYNLLSNARLAPLVQASYVSKHLVVSQLGFDGELFNSGRLDDPPGDRRQPESLLVQPVFESIHNASSMVVAYIFATIPVTNHKRNCLS